MKRLVPFSIAAALLAGACGSSTTSSSSTSTSAPSSSSSSTGSSPTSVAPAGTDMNIGNPASAVTVNEDGSSLLEPYLASLAAPLKAAYSNITLSAQAGGSGKGISDSTTGVVQLGGSDAYLPPADFTQFAGVQNIPVAVSSQSVDYNLPGLTNLKLSGNVVAEIFQGKITTWNDPAIAALNSGVTLPTTTIVPVHRSDSSGDTFLFTSFLSKTNPAWSSGPAFNTTVQWPTVGGELTAQGNPGMVQTCSSTPGCIAYIGISAQAAAVTAKLGQAELQNAAGHFVLPTPATVTSAVAASTSNVPADLATSLIYASGAQSYPIVNFEYLIVKSPLPSSDVAKAIRTFLAFTIDPTQGSSQQYLSAQQFDPLPTSIVSKVKAAIAKIS